MPGIDQTRQFVPLKIAVLTVSDTRSQAVDKSGAALVECIETAGHTIAARALVTDDTDKIRAQVKAWIADPAIDVVISTGGTGFTGRDVTPEAIEPLFEKRMDGFATLFLGRNPRAPARLPLPAVQLRGNHAPARRALTAAQGAGRDRVARITRSENPGTAAPAPS